MDALTKMAEPAAKKPVLIGMGAIKRRESSKKCALAIQLDKITKYERKEMVGEGTYGQVFKAECKTTGDLVALKKIIIVRDPSTLEVGNSAMVGDKRKAELGGRSQANEGIPVTALREMKILQAINHQNLIRMREICLAKERDSIYMVFDYMEGDLAGYLSHPQIVFQVPHVKCIMNQILSGLAHLHDLGIIHRDLKGSNILIGKNGAVRLTDFGLAKALCGKVRETRNLPEFTNRVITLWYRAPELLLGCSRYGPEIDIWSVGCIFLELFTKEAVFRGENELQQLYIVYETCGSLDREKHEFVKHLPWFDVMGNPAYRPRQLRKRFSRYLKSETALQLADNFLALDPSARPTSDEALRCPYLVSELPSPCLPKDLPLLQCDWHELASKNARKKRHSDTIDKVGDKDAAAQSLSLELKEER